MTEWLHPAAPYLLGALLIPFLRGKVRQAYLLLIPALALVAVSALVPGQFGRLGFMGQELILGQADKLSILFAYVFSLMGFIGTIYALQVKNPGEHMAVFLYVGSALGVVFAGDYFTLFIFWEIMAFASAYLVFIQGRGSSNWGRLPLSVGAHQWWCLSAGWHCAPLPCHRFHSIWSC